MRQEQEAEQDLASLSQQTNYISEWKEINFKRKNQPRKNRESILEVENEEHTHERKGGSLKKEASEKYDLKKWEEKIQNINKIEYPIIQKQDLFHNEETYVLPKIKLKINPKPQPLTPPPRPKDEFTKRIRSIIEDNLIQKKIKKFKEELSQQRKEVIKKEGGFKSSSIPRSFMVKKHARNSWSQEILKWKAKPERQLKDLKKQLEFQAKRYSVPNLTKISQDRKRVQYDINLH